MAVVKGDPTKAGDFVDPDQVASQLHGSAAQPSGRRNGPGRIGGRTLSYGMGDKFDKANVGSLTKGYHVTMAAGMNHYVFTTDPVEIQVSGKGPFAITYANPADDPRTAK